MRNDHPTVSVETLSWLPCGSYWYAASPFSHYRGGIERAWADACRITARLIGAGIPVFSPIAHSYSIALHGNLDQTDHDIWLPADQPMMDAAHGLVVCMMDGWRESYGIGVEIDEFTAAAKPVVYLSIEGIL